MGSAEEIDVMIRAAELAVIRSAIEYCEIPESQAAADGSYGSLSAAVATLQELKAAPHDPLAWHERTWVDVRTGDMVKLPGTENTAYVRHAVHQGWHVDPRSSEYRPVAMEWTAVHVELTAGQQHDAAVLGVLDMDPTKPILIQLTQSEVDAIELLGGWLNRVGMMTTEIQPSV